MQNNELLSKIDRDKAREKISDYHQKKLSELFEVVDQKIRMFKQGKISAFDVDYAIHIYHQQSKELFSFINIYFPRNAKLPFLLDLIEKEENGEWRWEPREIIDER